ncbi:MAG: Mrp/NBP35 family ATP-binding protein [Thermoplasmatales archaeon]|nr:Mrp/NBP35 family ATP-binding protein [Thermoplasmatales archaeon]
MDLDNKIEENMKNVKHKISIISGKGGVGKTTVAVNLAYALAIKGYETGLLDADIHGPNVAKMLGIENEKVYGSEDGMKPVKVIPHLKAISLALLLEKDVPVIWRGPLKMVAIKQLVGEVKWGNLEFLIVDLPPGTGDESLSIAQILKNCNAVIVTTPQDVALLDSRRAANFARQVGMNIIGIIENMSGFKCPYCRGEINLFKIGGGEEAAKELNIDFLGRLSIDEKIVMESDAGIPFVSKEGESREMFMKIVDKILEKIGK